MKKETEQSYFNNLPACAAEYIKLVIKKMKWKKSVRADVQAELISHFEDAIRDCKTNEEKETRAKELIANFGDAKLIADLARRAKKRCRPLWAKTLIKAFQALCAVTALFTIYFIWFITGTPKITTNYIEVANKLARPTADDSQNASPFYEKAAKILKEQKDEKNYDCTGKTFAEANETDIASIREWLDKNTETFNLIAQGTEKPYYWQKLKSPDDGSMLGVLMPNLGEYRRAAYGLRWRAYLTAKDGHYQKAFADILTSYKLGKHQKGKATLIENLVGIAIESMSTATARTILQKNNVPAEDIASFTKNLRDIVKDEDFTMTSSFEFEKLFIYDEIQRCVVKSGFGMEHLYPRRISVLYGDYGTEGGCGESGQTQNNLKITYRFLRLMFTYQNSEQTKLTLDKYYDFWKDIAAETPYTFKGCNLNAEAEKIISGNILLRLLSPAMEKVITLSWRNKADVESTLVVAALHIYKQKNGNWPENLRELVSAGLLTSVPMDPFSDGEIVYKKTDDGFILYSFATDFDDDAGKTPDKFSSGKHSIWPGDGQDGDAVFWPVK